jgi:hypothetical protein
MNINGHDSGILLVISPASGMAAAVLSHGEAPRLSRGASFIFTT